MANRFRIDDAHFDQYLREIRETPLLTGEQELELARRVQAGDQAAREQMVRANLRLVVKVAKEFLHRGMSFADLVAEGNLGLIKAVERFDPSLENKFSTYGIWWIKQSIRRALVNSVKMVRVPSYMVEQISRVKQRLNELAKQGDGTIPDVREVALSLGLTEDQLDMLQRAMNSGTQSADAASAEGESTLSEKIEDFRTRNPADEVTLKAELDQLSQLLESIDAREAEILRLRYGIGVDQPMTLSEIGEKIGLTRERVRQIENEALRRLHNIITKNQGYRGDEDEMMPQFATLARAAERADKPEKPKSARSGRQRSARSSGRLASVPQGNGSQGTPSAAMPEAAPAQADQPVVLGPATLPASDTASPGTTEPKATLDA